MSEPLLTHQMVGLEGGREVLLMNPDGHSHQHVLRSFNHLPVHPQKVSLLQSLEAKEIISIVPLMVDFLLNHFLTISDHKLTIPC